MSMLTARNIFDQSVSKLPAMERLRLAAMILEQLASPAINRSDAWNKEDIADLLNYSLRHSEEPGEEEHG